MAREKWVVIRVPLSVIERAVTALKATSVFMKLWGGHPEARNIRQEASADEEAARILRKAERSRDESTDTERD